MRKHPFGAIVAESVQVYKPTRAFAKRLLLPRPAHHGWQHALDVQASAWALLSEDGHDNSLRPIVGICALLHDVADKKVAALGDEQALNEMMYKTYTYDLYYFMNMAIPRVSMSFERNMIAEFGRNDFADALGPTGALIRGVVSDADKLESLGKKGFQRILEFNQQSGDVHAALENIMNVRMQYVPAFMTTHAGRVAAIKGLEELNAAFEKWKNENIVTPSVII